MKNPGNSCQIKINFSIQTTRFPMKYNLLCFQIFGRLTSVFPKHTTKLQRDINVKLLKDIND